MRQNHLGHYHWFPLRLLSNNSLSPWFHGHKYFHLAQFPLKKAMEKRKSICFFFSLTLHSNVHGQILFHYTVLQWLYLALFLVRALYKHLWQAHWIAQCYEHNFRPIEKYKRNTIVKKILVHIFIQSHYKTLFAFVEGHGIFEILGLLIFVFL